MKIAFYLANSGIEDVDLSTPEVGNPGVGGTEFLTVSLPYYLSNHNSDSIEPIIYANSTARLPESIQTYEAQDASEALHRADRDDVRFYIWTPSDTIEGREFIQNTDMYDVSVICWMHNITSTNFLHDIDSKKNIIAFVFVGREQLDILRDCRIFDSSTFIFNGLNTTRYKPEEVVSDNKTVIYIGSLIPTKGFHILAKMWPEIRDHVPSARLRVIGTGNLYDRSQQLGRWGVAEESYEEQFRPYLSDTQGKPHESVSFEGIVSSEQKVNFLQNARVGVANPSGRTANCPGSAIEIQAAGTPIVSTAYRGLLDVVQDGRTGRLGKDNHEIRDSIINLLQNETLAADMGENGIEFVESQFNYQHICNRWAELLVNLSAGGSPTQPEMSNWSHNYKYAREIFRILKRQTSLDKRVPCIKQIEEDIPLIFS